MPQVAELRNTYGPKNGSPKSGPPKGGFSRQFRKNGGRSIPDAKPAHGVRAAKEGEKPEAEILFQKYFKSVGPRTYAAQLKRAANGNQFLVLTEGKRDEKTGDVRKTKLFVWSEDFVSFFRMLHETAKYIRENPLPEEIRLKRERYWAKQGAGKSGAPSQSNPTPVKPKFDRR